MVLSNHSAHQREAQLRRDCAKFDNIVVDWQQVMQQHGAMSDALQTSLAVWPRAVRIRGSSQDVLAQATEPLPVERRFWGDCSQLQQPARGPLPGIAALEHEAGN